MPTNASILADYASGIGTQGTTLTIDGDNQSVGIGTTLPTSTLDVNGDVNVTGIITATSFYGNVIGDVSGDVTGNADTATYADVAGIATYATNSGIATYATVAGIATVAENLTGNPTISVTDITAIGNVSIAGTLTYEDVTNVDSIGIITAQSGIDVTNGGINVTGVATATTFDGNLTGNVTGNVNGNVTGNVTGNITGNVTGGTIVGTSASISGIATTYDLVVTNSAYTSISTTDTNKTIVNREYVTVVTGVAGTNANITITLPASPNPGWEVAVAVGGTFLDTVVARNGSNIMALAEDITLDRAYISVQFVYVDAYTGWRFF